MISTISYDWDDIQAPTKSLPNPSEKEMNTQLFNKIFEVIKDWDINAPDYYSGYMSGNGSHVKLLMDAIIPALREDKINSIVGSE